jgi:hypothetical protein
MEIVKMVVILVASISLLGVLIYNIAAAFYLIPIMFEGRFLSRKDAMKAIPKPLRRFGNVCIVTFFGLLAFALVVEFCANLLISTGSER